ncbi:hypothetical protein REJC140_00122 [Pseudorhizobium endolithicum]|uniref:Uncharacterized protein n=1 Tax=Pseudorhizobium endolithicum TaxID=1191678 RepID=A0ABM8PCL3_9HYPH|nr:hypothetical protein [Pseudorhizobium endolithicum]CAD7023187.1 hypothetical protein REJC140_00122 [Pseudorhizobium endolithicum]
MPDDLYSLIITGVIAVVVLWLVVFVVRKLIGVALLIALAIGLWMVWNDSSALGHWADTIIKYLN